MRIGKKKKSSPLLPGDKIGIVAPASPVNSPEMINESIVRLKDRGYQVIPGETIRPINGDLAGADWLRRADLEKLWAEPTVKAVWCIRGGYGSGRLLTGLSYKLFARFPKILVGFSDITALELGLWSQTKLVTFHGPVLTALGSNFSMNQSLALLSGENSSGEFSWPNNQTQKFRTIKPGKGKGIILGGNLTTFCSLLGTRYLPNLNGVLLFLEEIKEDAYRIDRMLTQLLQTRILNLTSAVVFGQCIPAAGESELDLIRVITERLRFLKCPSAYGFPIGHISEQWTIPQGVMGEVDTEKGTLTLLESPFK